MEDEYTIIAVWQQHKPRTTGYMVPKSKVIAPVSTLIVSPKSEEGGQTLSHNEIESVVEEAKEVVTEGNFESFESEDSSIISSMEASYRDGVEVIHLRVQGNI